MALNQVTLARIRESKITGDSIVKLFEMLAQAPVPAGATVSINLGWQQPDDVIAEGDLFPTLTFTLRAPATIQSINGSSYGPSMDGSQATA